MLNVLIGIFIPLLGTTLGAAMVFILKDEISAGLQKILTGFAAGVMTAASFWSLLQPSLEQAEGMGRLAFVPAAAGFLAGIFFLLVLDVITPHIHMDQSAEGPKSTLSRTARMILAVTLHNIPEGMAVGVVLAGWMSGNAGISFASALALSLGIALQNFPEGAIVSMPLKAEGMSRGKTFFWGFLSGAVEPLGALATILFTGLASAVLPYFLSFAAGAMMYVVIEELVPEMAEGEHSNTGTIAFAMGFVIMMILDVALG